MRTFFKVTRWARAIRFWVFLALAGIAWLGFGEARAQDYANCYDSNEYQFAWECPSRDVAYAQAKLAAQQNILNTRGEPGIFLRFEHYASHAVRAVYRRTATAHEHYGARTWPVGSECPGGLPWDDESHTCGTGCEGKSDLVGYSYTGAQAACRDGCAYTLVIGSGDTTSRVWTVDGVRHTFGTLAATGDKCQVGQSESVLYPYDASRPTCVETGNGFSECVEPSGRHCVTGAKGGRYCWEPSESGPRSNSLGTEGATLTLEGQPVQKPANMPDAPPITGTTTTNNNNTRISTFFSGGGGQPGQGNVGTGGRDGTGTGNGNGNGDGDGEGNEPGAPGAGVGDLYEASEKTVGSVFSDFRARIENAPIIDAATGFFSAPSGGGACPVWTYSSDFTGTLVFDFFCSGVLGGVLILAGWLVMAVAAYKAFHIGVGD